MPAEIFGKEIYGQFAEPAHRRVVDDLIGGKPLAIGGKNVEPFAADES